MNKTQLNFFNMNHYQKRVTYITIVLLFLFMGCNKTQQAYEASDAEYRTEVSQYGITWTFDKPARTGQFITGDWWVQGPVTIVKITPAPGPVPEEKLEFKVNRWNDTSLKADTTMRNGSMIVLKAGNKQSYDSRAAGFSKADVIKLPLELNPNLSLISSISNTTLPVDNFAKEIMWDSEVKSETVMKAAAVLTCVKEIPPKDSFRPPYVGTDKPFFRDDNIRWDLLPKLAPAGEVPSWELFERYFQRPWIDHLMSWSQQQLVPNENGPNYGREHARIVSIASLMVSLDVPKEKKEKLTIGLIQRGIDLYGLAMVGGYWNEGGGHSSGRKWPIWFASIMLDDPTLRQLPETAFFQEDTQTYYGKGWFGQTALYWMIQHHGQRSRYEEKPPEQWEKWDRTTESYRTCCSSVAWVGTALTARYMKAIKAWNHDAHFDYVDRWMREDDPYASARGERGRPERETTTFDPFVTEMWKAHRKNAPEQEMAGNPRMWVWEGKKGVWVPNPKPVGSFSFAQNRGQGNEPDFFPIAVWAQNPAHASDYKENGINMYISIHGGLDQDKLDHLKKADMKVIAHQNNFGLTKLDEPLIYGWMHGDEPDNAQRSKTEKNKWDPCRDPAVIISDYERIKKNDPSRPVYLNLGRGVAYTNWVGRGACRGRTDMYKISENGYLKGCDIASFDIYPVNASEDDVRDKLWYVAKGIDSLQEWSNHSKPTWCWIETTRISDKASRKPTPQEVKSEVWMALIHGAKGFGYFCHSFVGTTTSNAYLKDREMTEGIKAINAKVTSLARVLNTPNTTGYATVKSSNTEIPIDIMTKNDSKTDYIFAVAMRNGDTQATFEVKSGKKVEVLGENRTIKIKKGKFTDDFSSYEVHLYKVTK